MMPSDYFSQPGSEFDDFLCAPVATDKNGLLLSVLSALERLDRDPWLEAAKLAGLPEEAAVQRLASLIATLPDRPLADRELETISASLIVLLPRNSSNVPARETSLDIGAVTDFRAVMLGYAILIAVMLTAQWIVANGLPPAQGDNAGAPVSSTVLSQMPPSQSSNQRQPSGLEQ